MKKNSSLFVNGLYDGIPIALGYFSVSFGFGISASSLGIPTWASTLMSLINVTSAGQFAGISIIASIGTIVEMILTQLVINLRYSLMGLSLTQKLDDKMTLLERFLISYGITDEIFAVAISKEGSVKAKYMYGLILLPVLGWTAGTFLGAVAGNILPAMLSAALSLAIYGMFIAIVIPVCKKNQGVLFCCLISAVVSCALKYIPGLSFISTGFAVIICAIVASVIMAILKPVEEEK